MIWVLTFSLMLWADKGRGYNIFSLPSNEEEDENYEKTQKLVERKVGDV